MSPPRPNLFDFATSELSQDAFLCWCVAWADSRHAEVDPLLHAIGRDLVTSMFRAAKVEPLEGAYTVAVKRQFKHVDIVAELGDTHVLVIEDKVHSAEHSDQLNIYAEAITTVYPQRKRAFIYLKTGDQASYRSVTEDHWTTFLRMDLLTVLRRGSECKNAIYADFVATIEARESAVQRFTSVPVDQWGAQDPAYVGLYLQLQVLLGEGQWKYVANPSGGFLGFWWHFNKIKGGEIYLQLEESTLVAKISTKNAERRGDLRDLWHRRVVGAMPEFSRPGRFGSGQYMTVASAGDYRIKGLDGRLDLAATVQRLKAAADALSRLVGSP